MKSIPTNPVLRPLATVFATAAIVLSAAAEEPAEPDLEKLAAIPASKFVKVIDGSTSPDKRFAAAVGSADGSVPEWDTTPINDKPTFTLDGANIANYLVDVKNDRVTGVLDANHFGTAGHYNHESATYNWSADGRWLLETQSWKWQTAICTLHRVGEEGALTAAFNFNKTLGEAVLEELGKKGVSKEDLESFTTRVYEPKITGNGGLFAKVVGEKPKDPDAPFVTLAVTATVKEADDGSLTVEVTKVAPAELE